MHPEDRRADRSGGPPLQEGRPPEPSPSGSHIHIGPTGRLCSYGAPKPRRIPPDCYPRKRNPVVWGL